MKLRSTAMTAGLALGLMVNGAKASVVYQLNFTLPGFSLQYTSPDFITSPITVQGSDLDRCTFTGGCQSVRFTPNATVNGMHYDQIYTIGGGNLPSIPVLDPNGNPVLDQNGNPILVPPASIGNEFDFQVGTFSHFGTTPTMVAPNSSVGTLTVQPGTVPLPSSAPLFGAGLIALVAAGYAAQRKKAVAA